MATKIIICPLRVEKIRWQRAFMILRIFANCKIKRKLHIDQALCFYEHIGFYPIGTYRFLMGRDNRTDCLMRKDLQP